MYTSPDGNVTCYGILFDFGCEGCASANPTAAMLGIAEIIIYIILLIVFSKYVYVKIKDRWFK